MCQPLLRRMVPVRRAQCINNLSVEFTSEPSGGGGFCTGKAPGSGGYLRQQRRWGGETRLVRRALGSAHVYVHTHTCMYIGLCIVTLPWMCRPLVCRMVPIRRAQCINRLSVEFTSEPSAGRGFCTRKVPASGGYRRCACMCTHTYMYVYRHVYIYIYKDFALDVPASCVAHGAHQARSVHEHPLFRIHQRTPRAPASRGYLRQQCGWGGETRQVRRALGSVHVYVHTHIHVCM